MHDPDNHAVYDVNPIAHYDAEIVLFLDALVGSACERENGIGPIRQSARFRATGGISINKRRNRTLGRLRGRLTFARRGDCQ